MGSSYGVHFKYQPALDDQLDHQNIRLRPLSLLDSGLYRFNLEIRGQGNSDFGEFSIYKIGHQDLRLVTNTFRLKHTSPKSIEPVILQDLIIIFDELQI